MTKLKNYNAMLQHFVIFLTIASLFSCSQQRLKISKIEGEKIEITSDFDSDKAIDKYIQPYRDHIDNDLNTILSYAPIALDKTGVWQSSIGNLLADITLQTTTEIFSFREHKDIDICLLNYGGIRSVIPKGNVTARNAFEVHPFENKAEVISLKSEQIKEMIQYLIKEKKPHPISGLTFTIDGNNNPKNILIKNKPLQDNILYYVVTSDYLINGGDNMNFFKNGVEKFDLDYKLRNIIIDYFKKVDTIIAKTDIRILKE